MAGFAGALLAGRFDLLAIFGASMLVGFWVFVYNLVRTLAQVDGFDVTERHFALSLGYFGLVTILGYLLALDFVVPVLPIG